MRALLWMTTGIKPRQWVAVHRKHHAFTDVEGDPHSPVLEGYAAVQFGNVGMYRRALRQTDLVDRYAKDLPPDRWDRVLFDRAWLGLGIGIALLCLDARLAARPGGRGHPHRRLPAAQRRRSTPSATPAGASPTPTRRATTSGWRGSPPARGCTTTTTRRPTSARFSLAGARSTPGGGSSARCTGPPGDDPPPGSQGPGRLTRRAAAGVDAALRCAGGGSCGPTGPAARGRGHRRRPHRRGRGGSPDEAPRPHARPRPHRPPGQRARRLDVAAGRPADLARLGRTPRPTRDDAWCPTLVLAPARLVRGVVRRRIPIAGAGRDRRPPRGAVPRPSWRPPAGVRSATPDRGLAGGPPDRVRIVTLAPELPGGWRPSPTSPPRHRRRRWATPTRPTNRPGRGRGRGDDGDPRLQRDGAAPITAEPGVVGAALTDHRLVPGSHRRRRPRPPGRGPPHPGA